MLGSEIPITNAVYCETLHNEYLLGSYIMSYCIICVTINVSTSKYMAVFGVLCVKGNVIHHEANNRFVLLLLNIQYLDAPMILGENPLVNISVDKHKHMKW